MCPLWVPNAVPTMVPTNFVHVPTNVPTNFGHKTDRKIVGTFVGT